MDKKLLFIGLGFELEIVFNHILKYFNPPHNNILFTRRNKEKAIEISGKYGVNYMLDNVEAIDQFHPDIIFIGVKPNDIPTVLTDLKAAKYQDYKELIFITSSLPLEKIAQIFPNKKISNIVPDDHIDTDSPSNIVNFCSNTEDDETIKEIFEPTCKKLVKVNSNQMTEFTALTCQGNPMLQLFLLMKEESKTDISQFDYITDRFTNLLNCFLGVGSEDRVINKIYNGYIRAIEEISLNHDIALEVLQLTFEGMVYKKKYYEQSPNELAQTMKNWATEGGYEERGIEVINNEYGEENFDEIPIKLVREMEKRGNEINKKLEVQLANQTENAEYE